MLHSDVVRRILTLYHYQHYSIKDIMGTTKVPRDTVSSIVHRRTQRAQLIWADMETGREQKPIAADSARTQAELDSQPTMAERFFPNRAKAPNPAP